MVYMAGVMVIDVKWKSPYPMIYLLLFNHPGCGMVNYVVH